jgi:hypothetical protein
MKTANKPVKVTAKPATKSTHPMALMMAKRKAFNESPEGIAKQKAQEKKQAAEIRKYGESKLPMFEGEPSLYLERIANKKKFKPIERCKISITIRNGPAGFVVDCSGSGSTNEVPTFQFNADNFADAFKKLTRALNELEKDGDMLLFDSQFANG